MKGVNGVSGAQAGDSMTKKTDDWHSFWMSGAVGRLFICHYSTVGAWGAGGVGGATPLMNIRFDQMCV